MTAPIPRREVLAFIALADAPMPDELAFTFGRQPMIALDVDDAGAVERWAELFGLDKSRTNAWVSDGNLLSNTVAYGRWRGWPVRVETTSRTPVDELDEDTARQLREIAGGDQ